jgi:hypothetical protein
LPCRRRRRLRHLRELPRLSRSRCSVRQARTVAMDTPCRDQRDRDDDDGNSETDAHKCSPPCTPTRNVNVNAASRFLAPTSCNRTFSSATRRHLAHSEGRAKRPACRLWRVAVTCQHHSITSSAIASSLGGKEPYYFTRRDGEPAYFKPIASVGMQQRPPRSQPLPKAPRHQRLRGDRSG